VRIFVLKTSLSEIKSSDIPAKALVASLLISNSIRRDSKFLAYLEDKELVVEVHGGLVKRLWADYNSARGVLLAALKRGHVGTRVWRSSWDSLLRSLPKPIYGIAGPNCGIQKRKDLSIILNMPGECAVSQGLSTLLPHHVAVVANILLDRSL